MNELLQYHTNKIQYQLSRRSQLIDRLDIGYRLVIVNDHSLYEGDFDTFNDYIQDGLSFMPWKLSTIQQVMSVAREYATLIALDGSEKKVTSVLRQYNMAYGYKDYNYNVLVLLKAYPLEVVQDWCKTGRLSPEMSVREVRAFLSDKKAFKKNPAMGRRS